MQFHIFECSPLVSNSYEALNRFLSTNQVKSVQKKILTREGSPTVVFVVETAGSKKEEGSQPSVEPYPAGAKIDYREKLEDDQRVIFDLLRDLRAEIASEEKVPRFKVLNNAQLAAMVEGKVNTVDALGKIPGIGAKKLEKYGDRFLAILRESFPPQVEQGIAAFPITEEQNELFEDHHETNQQPF